MSFKIGHCCCCGAQVWITDALNRLVHPLSNLREGYLVFTVNNSPTRLKISVCNECEATRTEESLNNWLNNLLESGEASMFRGLTPTDYEPFEEYWASQGKEVFGVWRNAPSPTPNAISGGL